MKVLNKLFYAVVSLITILSISSEMAYAKHERTLCIIKPDAVNKEKEIKEMIEKAGLKIVKRVQTKLTKEQVKEFYQEHEKKDFFNQLVEFMISGEVVIQILKGKDDTIKKFRDLMGATNPANAAEGTIRKKFGTDTLRNAVHGSDSEESAKKEIAFFKKQGILAKHKKKHKSKDSKKKQG